MQFFANYADLTRPHLCILVHVSIVIEILEIQSGEGTCLYLNNCRGSLFMHTLDMTLRLLLIEISRKRENSAQPGIKRLKILFAVNKISD